jgi:hypothetical protein
VSFRAWSLLVAFAAAVFIVVLTTSLLIGTAHGITPKAVGVAWLVTVGMVLILRGKIDDKEELSVAKVPKWVARVVGPWLARASRGWRRWATTIFVLVAIAVTSPRMARTVPITARGQDIQSLAWSSIPGLIEAPVEFESAKALRLNLWDPLPFHHVLDTLVCLPTGASPSPDDHRILRCPELIGFVLDVDPDHGAPAAVTIDDADVQPLQGSDRTRVFIPAPVTRAFSDVRVEFRDGSGVAFDKVRVPSRTEQLVRLDDAGGARRWLVRRPGADAGVSAPPRDRHVE